MRKITFLLACLLIVITNSLSLHADTIEQPHVQVELVTEYQEILRGQPIDLALRMKPEPGWHLYWKYAGDYGSAPKFFWSINGNEVDSQIFWPGPTVIHTGPYINYGYESEVFILFQLPALSPDDIGTEAKILLDSEWLVCNDECIPGNAFFELKIPIVNDQSEMKPASYFEQIGQFRKMLPIAQLEHEVELIEQTDDYLKYRFSGLTDRIINLRVVPEQSGVILNSDDQHYNPKDHTIMLKKAQVNPQLSSLPAILIAEPDWGNGIKTKSMLLPITIGVTTELENGMIDGNQPAQLWKILIGAFIGGLILNLMPCVFPVIAIKILHFVKKAGESTVKIRFHGLLFSSGILLSFWAMALGIRLLRHFGEDIGWGFQLQEPRFVLFLIFVLLLVSFNLFGLFEFGFLFQKVSGKLENKSGEGYLNSFASGVFTTVLATPCTAPFMAGALAYGLTASIVENLLVFSFIGIGLSAPYLLLSFYPKWLSRIPKPGNWMKVFKEFLGFPVLLTALWLLWVFEQQVNDVSLLFILIHLLGLAFVIWFYGNINLLKKTLPVRWLIQTISLIAVVLLYLNLALPINGENSDLVLDGQQLDNYGLSWKPYSAELISELRQEGKAIYLDFTASWCVTCQFNKARVFGSKEVVNYLNENRIELVRADWTNRDPIINEAIKSFGRAGVPLNVYYPAGDKEPVVLPSLLDPEVVLEYLKSN